MTLCTLYQDVTDSLIINALLFIIIIIIIILNWNFISFGIFVYGQK